MKERLLKSKERVIGFVRKADPFLLGVLFGVAGLMLLILYPGIAVRQPLPQPGDVVQKDVKAPRDFLVEDTAATEANRDQAIAAVLTVYDHDSTLLPKAVQRIQDAFGALRKMALKELPELIVNEGGPGQGTEEGTRIDEHLWRMKDLFENKLGGGVDEDAYRVLIRERFNSGIEERIIEIVSAIINTGIVANLEVLLTEQDRGIRLRDVATQTEQTMYNLHEYYSLEQAKNQVRIVGQPLLKNERLDVVNLIVGLSQKFIEPNISLNRQETTARKTLAGEEIKPFLYRIKAGEMLMREGDRVTSLDVLKLKAMHSQIQTGEMIITRIGASMIFIGLLVIMYIIYLRRHPVMAANSRKKILFMACALVVFFLIIKISAHLSQTLFFQNVIPISGMSVNFGIPVAAGAMTVGLFLGLDLAIPFAIVLAASAGIVFNNHFEMFLYFLLSGVMGAYWIKNCRERIVFIKAGVKLGLVNILLVTAIDIHAADMDGLKLFWDWLFAFLGGVSAGIVAAGIVPLVETSFDFSTDIKLLEGANLDRPLLRRLMLEAPGTYHHSVIVGTMVEAAASAIGANPILARACGYYHDIGKISKPHYFIENQQNTRNKHDRLAPSISSLILISHIKDGVALARQNKLGKEIVDAIQQHHGTSQITYFLEKAKQAKGEESVNVEDFRYPGPKPQTREAGLVMLADVVEAASRTLENPTPIRIQGLVQNLINKIFADGQLDNCELTLRDLHSIAKTFNTILSGIYHHRIEYPEKPATANGKTKNGSSDKQQPDAPKTIPDEDNKAGEGHLKRLGMS